jgi:hypothetical protein
MLRDCQLTLVMIFQDSHVSGCKLFLALKIGGVWGFNDCSKCSCSGLNGDCPICGDGIWTRREGAPSRRIATKAVKPLVSKKGTLVKSTFDLAAFALSIERDAPKQAVPITTPPHGPTPTKRETKLCNLCDPPQPITLRKFTRHQVEIHGHHATRVLRSTN